ncbi:MAG: sulfotransferase [Gemmatimonadetes bacterium]|nr:sulfotransferase [Gemmatimonadota bacterium]
MMPRNVDNNPAGRERIDFVIGGTQKGGTSALDQYLRLHPDLCMAHRKEPHFFDNEEVFASQSVSVTPYHANFDWTDPERIRGEATPIYMYWSSTPRRIWQYNPSMKWILILRNPIERAYSHWNMETQRNAERLPFFAAIEQERARVRTHLPHQHRRHSYIDRGYYCEQIRRIWHLFSQERTLILRNEELRRQPQATIHKICDFLGAARMRIDVSLTAHELPYKSAMTSHERQLVQAILEPEIHALERLLGWDCSGWLREPERSVAAG